MSRRRSSAAALRSQRGATGAGVAVRIAVAVVVILVVAGGVYAYGVISRSQLNPNRQAAWAARGATAVAAGPGGTLYVAFLREIYRVDLDSGTSTLVAGRASDPGNGEPSPTADGQPAVGAAIRPTALAIGPKGQVYFADQLSDTVRTITGGDLTSIGRAEQVGGVAVDESAGTVYFADEKKNQVFAVTPGTGAVSTVAGSGTAGDTGDGASATIAELSQPDGLAVSAGRLLIADSGNNRVRAVDLRTKIITTVAGNGHGGMAGDGHAARMAQLTDPVAVCAGTGGAFVVADSGNHRLRQVSSAGVISTIVGSGQPGTDDPDSSVAAASAHLHSPTSLAYVGQDLYFVDDFQLRKLSGGQVTYDTPPGSPS